MKKLHAFITVSFLLPCLFLFAQPAYKIIPPQFELEHVKLNNKEDLGPFNDIEEDKEGYLWLSSMKGLHVFDGNRTVSYTNGNEKYLLQKNGAPGVIGYIKKNEEGNFWLQEDIDDYYLFDPVNRNIIQKEEPGFEDGDELLPFGIAFEKKLSWVVINHQKQRIQIVRRNENGKAEIVFAAYTDTRRNFSYLPDGANHWLIEKDSIIRVNDKTKTYRRYTLPGGSSPIALVSGARFFVADLDMNFIYIWNPGTDELKPFIQLPALVKNNATRMYIKGDEIYLGNQLHCFIINTTHHTIQDLSSEFVALLKRETPAGLSTEFLKFFQQSDSSLLFCTKTNIYRLRKKLPLTVAYKQTVEVPAYLPAVTSFRALAEDEQNTIYASYYNSGISKKLKGRNHFTTLPTAGIINGDVNSTYNLNYYKGKLLWNNVVLDVKTGGHKYIGGKTYSGHTTQYLHNDTLWLFKWGTNQLICYDLVKDTTISYPFDKTIFGETINEEMNDMIGAADANELWISSRNNGLMQITKQGKLVKKYLSKELSISDNVVTDLELKSNILWFGCNDGLGLLNTVTGKVIIYKNPAITGNSIFRNRIIYSIQPNLNGNFYCGTNYGLVYFDTHSNEFYNLPEGHPLSKIEFNRASAFRSNDNRFYFGSTDGLYSFTPTEIEFIKSSGATAQIKLYNISVFNSRQKKYRYETAGVKKLVLQAFDNNIELNFSSPSFSETIYYSYRIQGGASQWSEYKPDNNIQLPSLQPGHYVLEVKASATLIDEVAAFFQLPIEVKQVWYKKAWVIILSALFVFGIISLLLRYRYTVKLKRQKELAALRTRISSDLHDDVGTILSGLAMQSQMLAIDAKDETKDSLLEISSMSRDAMERMRDTVWAIDSRKDKFENLLNRMRDYAEKNLALKNITHEFLSENIEGKKFISPEKRQNIYLIFKEAITNIIKHSDGKHVNIRFTHDKNILLLTIHDNGSETKTENTDGQGLGNMKMRAEKIGGTLQGYYENGFTVELVVPG